MDFMPFEKSVTGQFWLLGRPDFVVTSEPISKIPGFLFLKLWKLLQLSSSSHFFALEVLLFTFWPLVWPLFSRRKGD